MDTAKNDEITARIKKALELIIAQMRGNDKEMGCTPSRLKEIVSKPREFVLECVENEELPKEVLNNPKGFEYIRIKLTQEAHRLLLLNPEYAEPTGGAAPGAPPARPQDVHKKPETEIKCDVLKLVTKDKQLLKDSKNLDLVLDKLKSLPKYRGMNDQQALQVQEIIRAVYDDREDARGNYVDSLSALMMEKYTMSVTLDNQELLIWKDGTHFEGHSGSGRQDTIIAGDLEDYEPGMDNTTVNEVVSKIKRKKHLFVQRGRFDNKNGIAFENGWLDFETGKITDNSPDNMNRVYIASSIELPDRIEPEYEQKDIAAVIGGTLYYDTFTECHTDQETGKMNFEAFYTCLESIAYALSTDCSMQKYFIHFGKGSNGKSLFLEHLKGIIGNYSVESIHNLAENRFRIANLEGKLLNIYPDIEFHELQRGHGVIKALSEGASIPAERKNQDSYEFKNGAKLMFSANAFPSTKDQSDGWFRRPIIIQWNRQFKDASKDSTLLDRLINDKAGNAKLLGLLVRIREKLYARGQFRYEVSTAKTRQIWNDNSNPVEQFERLYIRAIADHQTSKREVHEAYEVFCQDKGIQAHKFKPFNAIIKESYDDLATRIDGEPVRVWQDMKLLKPIDGSLKDFEAGTVEQ